MQVEQPLDRLADPRLLVVAPFALRKPGIVVVQSPAQAQFCQRLKLDMGRGSQHDQRRQDLFQHIAVRLDQQPQVLRDLVSDHLHFHAADKAFRLERLTGCLQRKHLGVRRGETAPQVHIAVR